MLAVFALGASAYEVGDFVFSKTAKYKVTGKNLVTNGQFNQGATGTDGWKAINETEWPIGNVFTMATGGPNGSNTLGVISGANALTAGMYQKIKIDAGGDYVVSLQVIGSAAGFTDLDLTGASTNYINAYYNTDEIDSLATSDGYNHIYGTNGVEGGYPFSFSMEQFTDVTFGFNAPAEGYIYIDFRGLADGLQIANVECHLAEQVYDSRIAERRVAYLKKYLEGEDFTQKESYPDFDAAIKDVEDGVATNASADDMQNRMSNLELYWDLFTQECFSNVLDFNPSTDGSSITPDEEGVNRSNSNWSYWLASGKLEKLKNNYNGKAPWSWSTDRWRVDYYTRTGADGETIGEVAHGISWARGSSVGDLHIATLTVTLDKGTYYWGASGEGGMMTLAKNSWLRSWAKECVNTQFFFNGDTTEVFGLNPAVRNDYVFKYVVAEDNTTLTLGIILNVEDADGANAGFYNPVLYKVLVDGQLTPEQESYLASVESQLGNFKGAIDEANAYLADTQVELPWGKENLKAAADAAQLQYNDWAAMTQEQLLEMLDNIEYLADTISAKGTKVLNDSISSFESLNVPVTDMAATIASATATLGERIYASSSKKNALDALIKEAQTLYDTMVKSAYSAENAQALVDMKASVEAMVEEFKAAIDAVVIVDIDFGTQEAPATVVEHVDSEGLVDTYWTIAGAKGEMRFASFYNPAPEDTWANGTQFELGYNRTDSLGMLRVGKGDAVVELSGTPAKESDIVNISFDLYCGNLSKSSNGFKVLSAAGDTICGLYFSRYSGTADINSFEYDFNANLTAVGSSSQSNAKIAEASQNKTHFDVVLDYGACYMYLTTTNPKRGTATTEKFPLMKAIPAQFVLYSNYGNADRRSWFDNLLIRNIAAGVTDGIQDAIVSDVKADNAIYNLAGQRVAAPVKGQIYIQNGKKFVK